MASIRLAMATNINNAIIGDIYIGTDGRTRLTTSLSEEVQQNLWLRFQFFLGEWFLDPEAGVPWFTKILGVKNSDDNVSRILQYVITSCPGVASLSSFSLNRSGRAIAPRFACKLADGVTLTSADFPPFVLPTGIG
jgi:hypothetical protein